MKLTIADRLTVLQILPNQGDITTIRIVRDLQNELSFSEQEIQTYKIVTDGNVVRWDENLEKIKDVEIGPKVLSIIVAALEKLNKEEKLTVGYLPVYEKFLGEQP